QFRTAIIVAPFGVAGAFLGSVLTSSISNNYQEGIFLSVLLASSFMMLKSPKILEPNSFSSFKSVLLPGAFVIGVLSGLVGVGGGFLILPLLIYFGGLKFNEAAGTSLLLITSQSLAGAITPQLLLPIQERPELSWGLIFWFTIIGIIGLVFGDRLRSVLAERVLRQSFGFALMILSVFLVSR
ncbi:MAG: TSUP family transporter, partial [Proteobacteria bacterium]|nr:TSUP family transporter [Pseudomonadota bacterium]